MKKYEIINGSASRTGRDVGVRAALAIVGVRAAPAIVGQVRRVGQVGVRAKASECMELGMWGRL